MTDTWPGRTTRSSSRVVNGRLRSRAYRRLTDHEQLRFRRRHRMVDGAGEPVWTYLAGAVLHDGDGRRPSTAEQAQWWLEAGADGVHGPWAGEQLAGDGVAGALRG